MRKSFLICIGFCTAAAFSQDRPTPTAAEIRVRLLDYKTGRPLKGRHVWLTMSDRDGEYRTTVALEGKTAADGAAAFLFKTVPPPRILVVTPDDYECTEPEPAGFSTEAIVHYGIVGNLTDVPLCKPHTSEFPNRRPEELVFYAHRLNLWQRIHRAIQE
jgi:hypothetical protein